MTAPDVLARLEAAGVRLTLNASGDGLRVMGKGKPAPEVMAEVKAHKPALLAYLRGEEEGQRQAEALEVEGAQRRASLPTLPPLPAWEKSGPDLPDPSALPEEEDRQEVRAAGQPEEATPAGPAGGADPAPSLPSPEDRPAGAAPTRPASPLPDWAAEAAKPGRCGSCARAVPAPDWGPLMVACGADPVAWWPLSSPLALHVGAKCGAYLRPGEEIGAGYRSREAAQTWGTGQHAARPVPAPHRGGRA